MRQEEVNFDVLAGKTIASVIGMEPGSECVTFTCSDGSKFTMYHEQDCCESVQLEEVHGDPKDLIGFPLLMAEVAVDPDDAPMPEGDYIDSYTWTFYKLATVKGYVTLRWLGESNGYYSEDVSFFRVDENEKA